MKSNIKTHSEISITDIQNYGVTVSDLRELMKCRNQEAVDKLNLNYGGVLGLAHKLNSDLQTGLISDEDQLLERAKIYGKNEIPQTKPKSIFMLAFEALQDPTLIMLMICAIISIALNVLLTMLMN